MNTAEEKMTRTSSNAEYIYVIFLRHEGGASSMKILTGQERVNRQS